MQNAKEKKKKKESKVKAPIHQYTNNNCVLGTRLLFSSKAATSRRIPGQLLYLTLPYSTLQYLTLSQTSQYSLYSVSHPT